MQEGGVNMSDLTDPMIIAIMTSRRKSAQMHKIFENGAVASCWNNVLRRISPNIPVSNGIVFGSHEVITIFLSWEVSRF